MDTATPATAVAVWAPEGPAVERRDDPAPGERPGHASRLLALVDEVVDDWEAITRIAVGVGPGGFTGLRIGVATARALAQAAGAQLVGGPVRRPQRDGGGRGGGVEAEDHVTSTVRASPPAWAR